MASIPSAGGPQAASPAARPPATASVKVLVNVDTAYRDIGTQVRTTLFTSLVSEGIFARVVAPSDTSGYELQVQITEVKKVSGTSRFMVGAFAGRNHITASVRLMKRGNATPILSFIATGESSAMPMTSATEMSDAVRELDQKIREALKG